MSRKRLCVLVLPVILCLQGYAQDTVKLEYKWKQDQLLRYKVSNELIDGTGGFMGDMQLAGVVRIRTVKVLPDGGAELRIAYESGTLTAMSKTEEFAKRLQPLTFTMSKAGVIKDLAKLLDGDKGTVTVTGRIEGGTSSASTDAYGFVLEALSNAFPTKELKVGDTWTQLMDFASIMEKPIVAQCKLNELNAKDGDHNVVRFVRHASVEEMGADEGGALTEKVSTNSAVSFSAEHGFTTRVDSEHDLHMTIGGGDGLSGTFDIKLKDKAQLELLSVEESS